MEVLDLDQAEDGSPYIVMEYVEGPDLLHTLNSLKCSHPKRSAKNMDVILGDPKRSEGESKGSGANSEVAWGRL